jgi:hypothetical protein
MKCHKCENEATVLIASTPQYVPACSEHNKQISMEVSSDYVNAVVGGTSQGTPKTRTES